MNDFVRGALAGLAAYWTGIALHTAGADTLPTVLAAVSLYLAIGIAPLIWPYHRVGRK